jgi:large subunit ribosomal protein L24
VNKLKKGDTVIINKGKDAGKKGKILTVLPKEKKVIVEKIKVVKKHKKAAQNDKGGIVDKILPICWSKVKLVCPRTNKPTRVAIAVVDGVRKRKAVASGEIID